MSTGRARGRGPLINGRVHSVAEIGPAVRKIWVRGPALALLRCSPGAHVTVTVPGPAGPVGRVYSVWRHDPRAAALALRVVLHPAGGPGCRWATEVTPGDPVVLGAPRSKITLDRAARYHVFVGDETGAVPLLAMHAALAGAAASFGVFETATEGDEFPAPDGGRPFAWVYRGQGSPVRPAVLLRAADRLDLPRAPGTAYLAGESETCRLLQQHFVQRRGWPLRSVKVQAQWTPGRAGFGAGPAAT